MSESVPIVSRTKKTGRGALTPPTLDEGCWKMLEVESLKMGVRLTAVSWR